MPNVRMLKIACVVVVAITSFSLPHPCMSKETQVPAATADRQSSMPDGQEVLRKLVQYDSIYKSGFAASARERRMDKVDIHGPFFRVDATWRMTSEGDRTAFFREVIDHESPPYLSPDNRKWSGDLSAPKLASGEALLVSVRIQDWGYWGEEACGNHEVHATMKVLQDGQVSRVGTMYNSYLFARRDLSPVASQRSFQWGLGRFFSDRLQKITRLERMPNGRLQVSAAGDMYKGANGIWNLEIEPDAAWIVRKATFRPESKPQRVDSEMVNEGTVWSTTYCIPKVAKVNFWGPIEDLEKVRGTSTQYLTFEPVVEQFDEDLYLKSQQAVLHNSQPELTLTDSRVDPPIVAQPNHPTPPKVAPAPPTPSRMWLVISNLGIVAVLVAYVLRARWRSSRSNR